VENQTMTKKLDFVRFCYGQPISSSSNPLGLLF
jgi:hypothetical protein